LPALQDRLNQIRAQKGEANQGSDVAPSDAVTLGRVLQRSDTARGELVKPRAPALDHLDQRRIASRGVVCCASPGSTSLVSTPRRLNATAAEAQ
jgi:hypothetical protein